MGRLLPAVAVDEVEEVTPLPEVRNDPLTPEAEKRIKELIPQLNADEWRSRENATQELIKMGKMVIPFVIEVY